MGGLVLENDKKVGVISPVYHKYYCPCGKIGEWKHYYDKYKFECDACGHRVFIYTSAKSKATVGPYLLDPEYKLTPIGNEKIEISMLNYSIIFKNDGESAELESNNNIYTYDFDTAKLINPKGKEVDIHNIRGIQTYKLMNEIIEFYNNTHEHKIHIRGNSYLPSEFDAFEKCLINKNLTVLQDFGMLNALSTHIDKIRGSLNNEGSNLENIMGLPKSIVKYIIDGYDYDGRGKQYRHEAILNIKTEYPKIPNDILLATAKLNERLFEIDKEQFDADVEQNVTPIGVGYYSHYKMVDTASSLGALVKNKYSLKALTNYLSTIYEYQGLNIITAIKTLRDYSQMNVDMKKQYEKYPHSLILAHDLTVRNYKYIANEVDRAKIIEQYNKNRWLEYEADGLCIIIPQSADEIIDEGRQLHHCVASYVKRVVNGECIIAFARTTANKDHSAVTIELNGQNIVQKRTFSDKRPNTEYLKFIRKWANARNLNIR